MKKWQCGLAIIYPEINMATCSFYHDIEGRMYYLPVETIKAYQSHKELPNLPHRCRKVLTQDGHCVRLLKNYEYPIDAQVILLNFKRYDEQEACAELGSLRVTQIDDKVGLPFINWFLASHEEGLFKVALAERAFHERNVPLFALTMCTGFKPYDEDVDVLVEENNSEMIEILKKHEVLVSRSVNWF